MITFEQFMLASVALWFLAMCGWGIFCWWTEQ